MVCVILDNSNLKIATSRNYHHFFPKEYLGALATGGTRIPIANITLIDGYSNKHRIGTKSPSQYIRKFEKDNKELAETFRTHLIKDMDGYGIKTDDYDGFIRHRSKAIASALTLKLMSMTAAKSAEAERSV